MFSFQESHATVAVHDDKSNVPQSDSTEHDSSSLVSKRSSQSFADYPLHDDELDNDELEEDVHWIVRGVNRIKRSLGLVTAANDETTKIKSKRKRVNHENPHNATKKPKKLSKTKEKLSETNFESGGKLKPRPKRRDTFQDDEDLDGTAEGSANGDADFDNTIPDTSSSGGAERFCKLSSFSTLSINFFCRNNYWENYFRSAHNCFRGTLEGLVPE